MKGFAVALALLLLFAAGCGSHGASQFSGQASSPEEVFGQCAFCHDAIASSLFSYGHADLEVTSCEFCHDQNLTPGKVGLGHRNVPACTDCHSGQMTHNDPAAGTVGECVQCHTPHGSSNIFLVRQRIAVPSGAIANIVFNNLKGKADGSFASESQPGTGVCEVCHTTTMFYRSDGTGEDHYPFPCIACHPHSEGFEPQ
jgi:predicted CXXCH cytochrome family protein